MDIQIESRTVSEPEGLQEVLSEIINRARSSAKPALSADDVISRLREFQRTYASAPQFSIGDIVTPRETSIMRGRGNPHIVIEIDKTISRHRNGDPHALGYGSTPTVRIAWLQNESTILTSFVEPHEIEPYTEAEAPQQAA